MHNRGEACEAGAVCACGLLHGNGPGQREGQRTARCGRHMSENHPMRQDEIKEEGRTNVADPGKDFGFYLRCDISHGDHMIQLTFYKSSLGWSNGKCTWGGKSGRRRKSELLEEKLVMGTNGDGEKKKVKYRILC